MRYVEFNYLMEGYPQALAAFIQSGADAGLVQKTIADFKQLVTRNQVKDVNQKNIDWWAKQGWEKFNVFVNRAVVVPSKTQVTRKKIEGQSLNLIDDDNWLILIPIDKESSCFHGKDSDWCTTKIHQGHFESYFYDSEITLIYCFNKQTGGMWALAAHKLLARTEMFDQKDNPLTAEEFKRQTNLNPYELRAMAMGDIHRPTIQASRDKWKESVELTEKLLTRLPKGIRSPEIEKQLLYNKHNDLCLSYIASVGSVDSGNFPLAIQIVAVGKDSNALQYIKNAKPIVQKSAFIHLIDFPQIRFIENPIYEVQMKIVSRDGAMIQYIKNPSEEVQLAAARCRGDEAINGIIKNGIKPSEDVQLAAVTHTGDAIQNIIRYGIIPSEAVQEAAINNDVTVFKYIILSGIIPSKTVQSTAIEKWGRPAITYINAHKILNSGSSKKQWEFITDQHNRSMIRDLLPYIKDSKVRRKLLDVESDYVDLKHTLIINRLGKLTDDEIKYVIDLDPKYAQYMVYMPEWAAQQLALGGITWVLDKVKNPSEEFQLAMVRRYTSVIDTIDWLNRIKIIPSDDVQIAAINTDDRALKRLIQHGITPSETVQLAAVEKSPGNIEYIKNPSMKVQQVADNWNKNYYERLAQRQRDAANSNNRYIDG